MKNFVKFFVTTAALLISSLLLTISSSADIRIADDNTVYFKENGGTIVSNPELYSNDEPIRSLSEIKDPNSVLYQNSPTTGDVRALVFLVDFADYRNSSFTKQQVSDILNNAEAGAGNYPYDSVSAYYERSSYGKLNMTFDVYGWYNFSNDRSHYFEELSYNDTMQEILDAYDEEIDYSQYDANNDGFIDLVYLMYTGPDEGYCSPWWSYVIQAPTHTKNDGESVLKFAVINLQTHLNVNTIAHETGHLFGLRDYYNRSVSFWGADTGEAGGLGNIDIMDNNTCDHNIFSKLLLGWVEPVFVNADSEISLSPLDDKSAKAVIITPDGDNNIFSEYFIVQLLNDKNFPSLYFASDGAVEIFHVDAGLAAGAIDFANDNSTTVNKLIKIVNADTNYYMENNGASAYSEDFYYSGMSLGVNTAPSSDFYNKTYTGINIDINDVSSSSASLSVTFGNSDNEAPYVVSAKYSSLLGKAYSLNGYRLNFSSNIYAGENFDKITAIKQGAPDTDRFTVKGVLNTTKFGFSGEVTDNYNYMTFFDVPDPEFGCEYIVTVPAGAVVDSFGNPNAEYTFSIEIIGSDAEYTTCFEGLEEIPAELQKDDIFVFCTKTNVNPNGYTAVSLSDGNTAFFERIQIAKIENNTLGDFIDNGLIMTVYDKNENMILKKFISDNAYWDILMQRTAIGGIFEIADKKLVIVYLCGYMVIDEEGNVLSVNKYCDNFPETTEGVGYPLNSCDRGDYIDVGAYDGVYRIYKSDARCESLNIPITQVHPDNLPYYDDSYSGSMIHIADTYGKYFNLRDELGERQKMAVFGSLISNEYGKLIKYEGTTIIGSVLYDEAPGIAQANEDRPIFAINIGEHTYQKDDYAVPLSDGGFVYSIIINSELNQTVEANKGLYHKCGTMLFRFNNKKELVWTCRVRSNSEAVLNYAFLNNGKLYALIGADYVCIDDSKTSAITSCPTVDFSDEYTVDQDEFKISSNKSKSVGDLKKGVKSNYKVARVYDVNGTLLNDEQVVEWAVIELEIDEVYSVFYEFTAVESDPQIVYGDVNGDGDVTMADLLLMKQVMVKVPGKTMDMAAADVNCDGEATMADLLRLKQYMVKVPGITLGK